MLLACISVEENVSFYSMKTPVLIPRPYDSIVRPQNMMSPLQHDQELTVGTSLDNDIVGAQTTTLAPYHAVFQINGSTCSIASISGNLIVVKGSSSTIQTERHEIGNDEIIFLGDPNNPSTVSFTVKEWEYLQRQFELAPGW